MRFRHAALAAALCTLSAPRIALAQDPVEAFAQQAQATSTKFVETMIVLMTSAQTMKEARGFKDSSEVRKKTLEDAKKNLTKADGKMIEALSAMAAADSKNMEEMAKDVTVMTAEQKALFKKGLLEYLVGVKETAMLAAEIPKLAGAATETAAGLMSNPLKFRKIKDSVGSVKQMASDLPGVVKGHGASISAIKNYVAKQGLDVDMSSLKIGGA